MPNKSLAVIAAFLLTLIVANLFGERKTLTGINEMKNNDAVMLERKDGSILFTTASSAQRPINLTASFGIAAGALLNYARLLNMDLKKDNIYAGIVSIGALVVSENTPGESKGDFPEGMPTITAAEVAATHWRLHKQRDVAEIILS